MRACGWGGGGILLGAEAEEDEGAGVGDDFGLPAVVGLELLHSGDAFGVPGAGGFAGEVASLDESGLDLSGAGWIHALGWLAGCRVGVLEVCRRSRGFDGRQGEARGGCKQQS